MHEAPVQAILCDTFVHVDKLGAQAHNPQKTERSWAPQMADIGDHFFTSGFIVKWRNNPFTQNHTGKHSYVLQLSSTDRQSSW